MNACGQMKEKKTLLLSSTSHLFKLCNIGLEPVAESWVSTRPGLKFNSQF